MTTFHSCLVSGRQGLIYRSVLGCFLLASQQIYLFFFIFQDKTHKVKVKKETTNGPAIYKFKFQRKR